MIMKSSVKIPSRLPLIIPDNKHYLEFLVSRAGKQRLAVRLRRDNDYQRKLSAVRVPQQQAYGEVYQADRCGSGCPPLKSPDGTRPSSRSA